MTEQNPTAGPIEPYRITVTLGQNFTEAMDRWIAQTEEQDGRVYLAPSLGGPAEMVQ